MIDRGHISQEDLALHAMRNLAPEESSAVAEHLTSCNQCRQELEELNATLGLLTLSVVQHPLPEGARQRLLSRIASAPPNPQPLSKTTPAPSQVTRSRTLTWVPWAAAAAFAILAIVLGVKVRSMNHQLRDASRLMAKLGAETSQSQQVLDVLTSPRAQRVTLTPVQASVTPTGRVTYLAERGGLIFEGDHLRPLPGNKTYELWIIPANGKAPIPAGLFRPDAEGTASLVLPQIPADVPAKAFGITAEKAGGSISPTMPILLSGSVPGV